MPPHSHSQSHSQSHSHSQLADVIAMGYRYPRPGALEELGTAIEASPKGTIERHLTRFVKEVGSLDLGAWEELHTATLDLSPHFVPYVGHVAWGENYRRGEFMADLNGAMKRAGIDLDGELPDHIAPILRYLAVVDHPRSDLLEVLTGAVETMQKTLLKASRGNPYRHLLAATVDFSVAVAGRPQPASQAPELRGTPVQVGRRRSGD